MDKTKAIWAELEALPQRRLEDLFADPDRVARFSRRLDLPEGLGIQFDWSKTHLDAELVALFERLTEAAGFVEQRAKLFAHSVSVAP